MVGGSEWKGGNMTRSLTSENDFELQLVFGQKAEPFAGMNDFYMVRAISPAGKAFIDSMDSPVFYGEWLVLGQDAWKTFIHRFWQENFTSEIQEANSGNNILD